MGSSPCEIDVYDTYWYPPLKFLIRSVSRHVSCTTSNTTPIKPCRYYYVVPSLDSTRLRLSLQSTRDKYFEFDVSQRTLTAG